MNILGIDTCFNACSVAVRFERTGVAQTVWGEQRLMTTGHAEQLMPMIDRVMRSAGMAFADIERIAVTHGPGTFTGTRISVAAARALSLALRVPVVGFSSLRAIGLLATERIPDCSGDRDAVLVVRDARRDECYAEVVDVRGASLTGPLLLSAQAAAALCPGYRLFAVGTMADQVAEAGRDRGRQIVSGLDGCFLPELAEPDIASVIGLAQLAAPLDALVRPLYLRPPDAKPQDGKSIPRAATASTAVRPTSET